MKKNADIEEVTALRQAFYEDGVLEFYLKTHTVEPKIIVMSMWTEDIIDNLNLITQYACSVDELIAEMPPYVIFTYYDDFVENGISIDFHKLADRMTDFDIAIYLGELIANGLDKEQLTKNFDTILASLCIPSLRENNINIDFLKNRSDWPSIKAAYEARFPEESI